MIAAATARFSRQRTIGKDTVADHLEAVARQRGVSKADPPPIPPCLLYLWNVFMDLHSGRTGNGFGANPVTWSDIEAYCRLVRLDLEPWEALALRRLDEAYLASTLESSDG